MMHFLIILAAILLGWVALSIATAAGWAVLRTWQKSHHHEGPNA